MHINFSESNKSCYIWVPFSARNTYKTSMLYQSTVESNKSNGYTTCVYVGGELPLISVIDELLNVPLPMTA